ncbi:MAG TPA: WYL domain-containing protein [Gemmatimonadota bacterium]|nr:WYL domain-containing protein [Gemmatimonadota bacterium]
MELTGKERERLRVLVEEARRAEPGSEVLASLAAKLTAGGGPTFAKYSELLEPAEESDREVLAFVRAALESSSRLAIRYTASTTGETTERVIRPFNIHFYDGREYLEAFCELRDADRVFAIGNISAILPLPEDGAETS